MKAEHIDFLKKHKIEYDYPNLSCDDLADICILVSDILQEQGFKNGNDITETGLICEEILDAIYDETR